MRLSPARSDRGTISDFGCGSAALCFKTNQSGILHAGSVEFLKHRVHGLFSNFVGNVKDASVNVDSNRHSVTVN